MFSWSPGTSLPPESHVVSFTGHFAQNPRPLWAQTDVIQHGQTFGYKELDRGNLHTLSVRGQKHLKGLSFLEDFLSVDKKSGSQVGGDFCILRNYFAISGDIFGGHNLKRCYYQNLVDSLG